MANENSGWGDLDLESLKPGKAPPPEVVTTKPEDVVVEPPVTEERPPAPTEPEKPDEFEAILGDAEPQEAETKKKWTRVQRLKHQRDLARQDSDTYREKAAQLEQRLAAMDTEKQEALKVGHEKYSANVAQLRDAAEREWKEAHEAGDSAKLLASQKRLVELTVEADRLKEVAPRVAQKPEAGTVVAPAPQAYDPKAMNWANKNKDWFGNRTSEDDMILTAAAFTIDHRLKEEGVPPNSDEFYEEMDKRLARQFPHRFKSTAGVPPVGAPARSAPASARNNDLTDAERMIAKRLGVPEEVYKAQKKAIQPGNWSNLGVK